MNTTIGTDMSDPEIFKYWSEMAIKDPERFERERREVIEELLSEAPEDKRERFVKLQWRIDMERSRASNPLSSCIRLNAMMWEFVCADNGFIATLQGFISAPETEVRAPLIKPARILPFCKK